MKNLFFRFLAISLAVSLCVGEAFAEDETSKTWYGTLIDWFESAYQEVLSAYDSYEAWTDENNKNIRENWERLMDWVGSISNRSDDEEIIPPVVHEGSWYLSNVEPNIIYPFYGNGTTFAKNVSYVSSPPVDSAGLLANIQPPYRGYAISFSYTSSLVCCVLRKKVNDSSFSFYAARDINKTISTGEDFIQFQSFSCTINNSSGAPITLYDNITFKSHVVPEGYSFIELTLPMFKDIELNYNGFILSVTFSEESMLPLPVPVEPDVMPDILPSPPDFNYPVRVEYPDDTSYEIALQVYNYLSDLRTLILFHSPNVPNNSWIPDKEKLKDYPLFAFPLMMVDDLSDVLISGYRSTFDFPVHLSTDFFEIDYDFSMNPRDFLGGLWDFVTYVFSFFMFYLLFKHVWDVIVPNGNEEV